MTKRRWRGIIFMDKCSGNGDGNKGDSVTNQTLAKIALAVEMLCAALGGICGIACIVLPVGHPAGAVFLALGILAAVVISLLCVLLAFWAVERALETMGGAI